MIASRPRRSLPASAATPTEVKTRREQVLLARDQVELKRLMGDLVPVTDMGQKIDAMINIAKSKLLSLGHKLAPRLAVEADAARCQEIVDEALREILTDLAAAGDSIQ